MNYSEYIAVFSVIAVITGWFISGYVNRRNEIAKMRLNYRMRTLKMVLDIKCFIEKNPSPFSDPDFLSNLENTRKNMTLYGEKDEKDIFEMFISSCEKQNLEKANKALRDMTGLALKRIRKGLYMKE